MYGSGTFPSADMKLVWLAAVLAVATASVVKDDHYGFLIGKDTMSE